MKKLLFLLILTVSTSLLFAQTPQDTIVIKELGYLQNDKLLNLKQLLKITKTNPAAFEYMQKAKKNYITAAIFASIGGFGLGYTIGGLIRSRQTNWTIFGIGAGFIAASIPFSSAYAKNVKKGVLIYNQGLQKNSF